MAVCVPISFMVDNYFFLYFEISIGNYKINGQMPDINEH